MFNRILLVVYFHSALFLFGFFAQAKESLPVRLLPVSHQVVKGDPLQLSETAARGTFTYAFYPLNQNTICDIVTRTITNKGINQITVYPLSFSQGGLRGFSVSHSGRYIAILVGDGGFRFPNSRICVLDTSSVTVSKFISSKIQYQKVEWSSDEEKLAYIVGGDVESGSDSSEDPLSLVVNDWRKGKEYTVTTNDALHGGFTWNAANQILFSVFESTKSTTPSLFSYDPQKHQKHIIFKDAFYPLPSPDNRYIAFFGSEEANHPRAVQGRWWIDAGSSTICVVNDKGVRRPLNRVHGSLPQLIWYKNVLVTLHISSSGLDSKADIELLSAKSDSVKQLTSLVTHDDDNYGRLSSDPQFSIGGIDDQGKLLVEVSSFKKNGKNVMDHREIISVGLDDGFQASIAQVNYPGLIALQFTASLNKKE